MFRRVSLHVLLMSLCGCAMSCARTGGEAHLRPVNLPEIKPAKFDGEKTVVKLPSAFSQVVLGGGGRFLIFHLEQMRQLAIFDVSELKPVEHGVRYP